MSAKTLTCQVTEVEDLNPDVFGVTLQGRKEAMRHAPGQYLELGLDEQTWVPFSIASAERGDGALCGPVALLRPRRLGVGVGAQEPGVRLREVGQRHQAAGRAPIDVSSAALVDDLDPLQSPNTLAHVSSRAASPS